MSVRRFRSVIKYLGQRAVPVLKGRAGAKKAIISKMKCAGRREVCMFNVSIKMTII
jgi:hypothetical protein